MFNNVVAVEPDRWLTEMRWQPFSGILRSLDLHYPPHLAFVLLSVINGVVFGLFHLLSRSNQSLWQSLLVGLMSGVATGVTWLYAREIDPDYEPSAFVAVALTIITLFLIALPSPTAPLLPPPSALLSYAWLIVILRILNRSTGRSARLFDLLGLLALTGWLIWQSHLSYGIVATAAFFLGTRLPDPHPRQAYFALAALVITLATLARPGHISQLWTMLLMRQMSPLATLGLLAIALLFFPVILSYHQTTTTCDSGGKLLKPLRIQAAQSIALAVALLFAAWQGKEGLITFLPLWGAILGVSLYRFLPRVVKQRLTKFLVYRPTSLVLLSFVLLSLPLIGCQPTSTPTLATQPSLTAVEPIATNELTPIAGAAQSTATPVSLPPPPTVTPMPTSSPTATPPATATPTVTLIPTAVAICTDRMPGDDLLTIVTLQYGLSRDYEPADLVPLADYLSADVTLGDPTEIRQVVVEPLVQLVNDMQSLGLRPIIISGYRSYSAQAVARQKWVEKAPDYVNILSAPPGHSEHQLGTAVDFGSPELPELVGQEDIEFHTYFYMTSEGVWLAENAHQYGFTLSYPREAQNITGIFYEPWHYRYVGVEMATHLREMGISLTAQQLLTQPLPCIPEESS